MGKRLFDAIMANTASGLEAAPEVCCLPVLIVNVCLIGSPGAKAGQWVLVDAGLPNSAARIIKVSEERFGANNRPAAIILTHGHFDHVGALGELLERWDVPIYAHTDELPYLTGQTDYPPADPTVDGGLMTEISPLYPHEAINLGNRVSILPTDGRVPGLKGWRWLHTPGHTPGHISLFRESDRVLVAGDAFVTVKQESAVAVLTQNQEIHGPPAYFTMDWQAAWDSVQDLQQLKPSVVVTGHGVPMQGEQLAKQLASLADEFDHLAVPEHGRYVPEHLHE